MAILTTRTETIPANKGDKQRRLRVKIDMDVRSYLRREFDKATFDYEALAIIAIAKEYHYESLAQEMQKDFDQLIETNQEAA